MEKQALTTLYGIKNCDSVKKARRWLEQNQITYRFHDFREDGITPELVSEWLAELGWEQLINRRSTSWKQLGEDERAVMDSGTAKAAILATPTLIKRPLLDTGGHRLVGFRDSDYIELFIK